MNLDWSNCFGSEESNYPKGLAILPNGNSILSLTISGENPTYNNYHGHADAWVIILNENGEMVNNRCFGGSDMDSSVDIEVGSDYIYLICRSRSTDGDALSEPIGNPLGDIWIVKTDLELNIIWEKKYGPLGPCWLCSSDKTEDGGLVVITDFFNQAGGDVSQYYGGTDIWTFEIDADGNMLWEKTLGNQFENNAGNILSTDHHTTMILGETAFSGGMVDCDCHSADGMTRDIWMVELDNQGEIIWQDCYGGTDWELGLDILQEDGGYTIFCDTRSNDFDVSGLHGEGQPDYWLMHIDENGDIEWQNCFGGTDSEASMQFYKTDDNGYVLIGAATSDDGDISFHHSPSVGDVWVVVLDSTRNILWEHCFGGYQHNYPLRNSIAQKGELDFIISATTYNTEYEEGDVDCVPYPIEDGYSNWVFRVYDPDVGIHNAMNSQGELSLYPNPANHQVLFELPIQSAPIAIDIINIFGKKVAVLSVLPNQSEIIWNCKAIPRGVYFYSIEIDGEVYGGKLIIQ